MIDDVGCGRCLIDNDERIISFFGRVDTVDILFRGAYFKNFAHRTRDVT